MKNFKLIALTTLTLVFLGMNGSFAQGAMQSSETEMIQKHQQMIFKKLGNADQNYDLRFINLMIMHHQAALAVAQDGIQKAQHPELKQLIQNMINNETQAIEQMKAWRMQWYGQ